MTTPPATSPFPVGYPYRLPDRLPDRHRPSAPDRSVAAPTGGLLAVTATTATLLAASSAPSPLYQVYQAQFGFSPVTLTAVFSVYVLALLLSLLTIGRLSDYVGRRPVLAIALIVEAAAMAVFLGADGTGALFAARAVQGLATGAAVGVLGAYLLDLQPTDGSRLGSLVNSAAATGGLGLGAVLAGVLIQYGPQPTRLVFVVFVAEVRGAGRGDRAAARRRSGGSRGHGPRCARGCSCRPRPGGRSCVPRRRWRRRGCWAGSCSPSAAHSWPRCSGRTTTRSSG